MAYDLIFGRTSKNISRYPLTSISGGESIVFTPDEQEMLNRAVSLKLKAESGDRKATRAFSQLSKKMGQLKKQAAKGDKKAQRTLLVLTESGLFNPSQQFSMLGSDLSTLRQRLLELRRKSPKTEDDRRSIEQITEKITRLEVMSGAYPSTRQLQALTTPPRSLVQKTQSEESMIERGSETGGSFIGNSIPHSSYRIAVLKAASRSARGKRPSTRDFFKAKKAVDHVIGKTGISIYMPGAKPGRRTL